MSDHRKLIEWVCEGLDSIQTSLVYFEQQREATATDVLLFRRGRYFAAKERCKAQKLIYITNFFKNKTFRLEIYLVLNTVFVRDIFLFDTVLYFLSNLMS
jgi:hypothetical protein